MAKTKTCTIRLCNKTYELKCNEDEVDMLHMAAQRLNEHLIKKKSAYKSLDEYQILLLSALQISHELIQCQNQQEKKRKQLTEFIASLEHKISQAAEGILP
ncbi:Cell division protein ZapA (plasmid) [Legionella adelaidensis]|uniref:Cell division protein ZapA n=1 Tax=Legionella adelaidensis TaxID=45056 RepID=A0A0W0R1D1_9GAMM|nr:cell division protein ZapA [Legionella adelaidensis]KTC64779.1 Cell division protein ZapA [Legionella adelaidensis]VEH82683.1 Cell division protein ZapA [Legionella adelaidensis]